MEAVGPKLRGNFWGRVQNLGVIFEGGSKLGGNFWRWVQNLGFNRLADFFGPTSKNYPQVMDPPPKITPELWTHASISYPSLVSK